MGKPFANPAGKKARSQILGHMGDRESLTAAGAASRSRCWYGKTGSPHAYMDDYLAQMQAKKDDGSEGVDSVSLPSPI